MLKRSVADANFFLEEIVELSTVSPNSHIAIAKRLGRGSLKTMQYKFYCQLPVGAFQPDNRRQKIG